MQGLLLFAIAAVVLISCGKNNEKEAPSLTTTWKETDNYYSIGGPIIWKTTEPAQAEVISFKANHVFYSSVHTRLNRYIVEQNTGNGSYPKLKLYEEGKTDTTYWFLKALTPDVIEIGFSGCIEGCGKRFVRTEKGVSN